MRFSLLGSLAVWHCQGHGTIGTVTLPRRQLMDQRVQFDSFSFRCRPGNFCYGYEVMATKFHYNQPTTARLEFDGPGRAGVASTTTVPPLTVTFSLQG